MKRLIAIVVAAFGLTIGGFMLPSPAEAHPVSYDESYNLCNYIRLSEGWSDFHLHQWRTFHYGDTHVTQCGIYRNTCAHGDCLNLCYQYVWGDPTVYYYGFRYNCFT